MDTIWIQYSLYSGSDGFLYCTVPWCTRFRFERETRSGMELRPHLDLARGAAAVRACASETAVRGGGGWAPPVSSFREAYAARGDRQWVYGEVTGCAALLEALLSGGGSGEAAGDGDAGDSDGPPLFVDVGSGSGRICLFAATDRADTPRLSPPRRGYCRRRQRPTAPRAPLPRLRRGSTWYSATRSIPPSRPPQCVVPAGSVAITPCGERV